MKKLVISGVKIYRYAVSPMLYQLFGSGCRFTPTCSEFAIGSIKKYGLIKGGRLFANRFFRCHPFQNSDIVYDPVP